MRRKSARFSLITQEVSPRLWCHLKVRTIMLPQPTKPTPVDWLCKNALGFEELPQTDRDAIMNFVFLWSLFESEVLGTNATARSIVKLSTEWEKNEQLKAEALADYLKYLQQRYVEEGQFTQHFDGLHLRVNDHSELVKAVLKGERAKVGEIAAALLIVVYRLRNNLFHGVKWAYGIRDQLDNFTNANSLLMLVLDANNHRK